MMCPLEQYGWLTDSRGPLIRGTGAVAIFRRAVQPRLCHRRAAQLTALSTVSLVPARRLVGNWVFVPLWWVSGTVTLGFVTNDFLEDGVVWYLSCCIHFWGWPGRCSILSHPRYPRCIFSHDRSGSTGPASTSLEFTRTLVSSLTAPFRHLLVWTSYRIIRDIGMIKIDSKHIKTNIKTQNHRHLMIRDMMMGWWLDPVLLSAARWNATSAARVQSRQLDAPCTLWHRIHTIVTGSGVKDL